MSANNDLPPLICRPIPRRPFAANNQPASSNDPEQHNRLVDDRTAGPNRLRPSPMSPTSDPVARFLDLHQSPQSPQSPPQTTQFGPSSPGIPTAASGSLSREQSSRNLTSSTLSGIFADTPTSGGGFFETGTPWSADTPARAHFGEHEGDFGRANPVSAADVAAIRQASMDLLMLQRQATETENKNTENTDDAPSTAKYPSRTRVPYVRPSSPPPSRVRFFFALVSRASLLFALGMGYGVLVSRLHRETQTMLYDDVVAPSASATASSTPIDDGAPPASSFDDYDPTYDWRYLTSWGLAGVVLGTLLPWFDGLWERTFDTPGRRAVVKTRSTPDTDWALVVRGIGAFAGVVFAMRKLPWASTMQASLTLALANPFLWYLLDRSKSGFLLSAAVGLVGSVVLTALNLDLMPNPGSHPTDGFFAAHNNNNNGTQQPFWYGSTLSSATISAPTVGLSLVSLATVEMAIWMISVLFCSCVCFGSIGRRLALGPTATSASA